MKRTSVVELLVLVPLAGLAGALAWRSRGWPLVHDAPLMHYIAWRIGEGAAPYRDIFDMNFPGVYLIHLAALQLFGAGDAGWRAFDLAWLAATCLAAGALAAPWGRLAAVGAALFFAVYHLAGGAWQVGQRDFFLCPFVLLAALGVSRWAERPRDRWSLVWGGLALGAGMTVKPHASLFAAALLAVVSVVGRRTARSAALAAAIFAAAIAAPPAAATAWVAAKGALAAWREIVFDYLVPLYSKLGQPDRWAFYGWRVWIPIGAGVAISALAVLARRQLTTRHVVAALGVLYGFVHFVGQGKGWEYHLYPLAAFAAIVLFGELGRGIEVRRVVTLPLLACIAVAAVMLERKGVEAADAAWIWAQERRVSALVSELEGGIGTGDVVQVLDTTQGAVHALLRLRTAQPTRFIYDFHFYHDVDTPIVRKLRAEFIAGFDAHPPVFVVLFEHSWPVGGYERILRFEELKRRLAAYRVAARRDGYIVYAR